MADRAWKRAEREIAKALGGQRVPVSGRGRGDAPDVRHARLSIEVKCRRALPQWVTSALEQAKAAAQEGQLPVVVLHEHGTRYVRALVVLELGDLQDLLS